MLIELSTLTGAIIVALGSKFAGLFTNDDGLAHDLVNAGKYEFIYRQSSTRVIMDYATGWLP